MATRCLTFSCTNWAAATAAVQAMVAWLLATVSPSPFHTLSQAYPPSGANSRFPNSRGAAPPTRHSYGWKGGRGRGQGGGPGGLGLQVLGGRLCVLHHPHTTAADLQFTYPCVAVARPHDRDLCYVVQLVELSPNLAQCEALGSPVVTIPVSKVGWKQALGGSKF